MTQDRSLQKLPTSGLARKVENLLGKSLPATVPECEESLKAMVVIDFMAYAQKVTTKKMDLITYEKIFKVFCKSFSSLSIGYSCMDIVFDLFLQQKIKQAERSRSASSVLFLQSESIDTNISISKQQLPVQKDRFWPSLNNKMKFQQAFIDWMTSHCQSDFLVFLVVLMLKTSPLVYGNPVVVTQ